MPTGSAGQGIDVGDAVLTFLGDTTNLDIAFNRVANEAATKMGIAASSVSKVGNAVDGVSERMAVGQAGAVKLGEVMNLAGEKSRESMYQARGEAGLLGEMFGFHLPRHVRSLIAELPGVGAALSAAFAATAVIFIIVKIVELIEKHELLAKAADKAALASENLAIQERDHTKAMEVANLRLDDRIAKLEGRPERNKLKEALLETSIAADQLASAFAKDFEKMDEEIEKTTSFTGRLNQDMHLWIAFLNASDNQSLAKAVHGLLKGTEETADALDTVHKKMVEINRVRAERVGPTEEEQVAAAQKLKGLYGELNTELLKAQTVLKSVAGDNKDALEQLTEKIISTTAAQTDADLHIENIHKQATIERKERAAANATILEKDAKHALTVQLANIDAWKAAQHAAYESHQIDLAQWLAAEVHASDAAEIAHEHYLQRVLVLSKQAGDATKIQAAAEELSAFQTKSAAEELNKLATAQDKHRAAVKKVVEEYEKLVGIDPAGIDKEFVKATKAAEALAKVEEELAKAQAKLAEANVAHAFHEQEEAIKQLAAFHLITEEQKAQRLEVLYQKESNAAIDILKNQLKRQDDAVKEAQAALTQGKGNPLLTDAQVMDLQKELDKELAAYTTTQAEILKTQDKFSKQMEALDKGRYGESLALAVGFGHAILAEKLKENHAALLSKQAQLDEAKARGENTKAIQLQIAALQKLEGELEKEIKATTRTQHFWDIFSADFKKHAKENGTVAQQMGTIVSSAAMQMQKAFESAMMAAILGGQGIGAALQQATAQILAQLAVQAGVKALYNLAEGLAAAANPFTAWMAPGYFLAAAEYALVAGAAGGTAAALSGSGGGGGSSRNNVSSSNNPGGVQQSGYSGGGSQQVVNVTHLATGGLVTGPTLAMVGEKGSEAVIPLTDPEAMARFANALLSPSTMRAASAGMGSSVAAASASGAAPAGFDKASMTKFAEHIAAHLEASRSGGGDTHIHNHIQGLLDSGTLIKTMDRYQRLVKQNRAAFTASDSLRVTKRSQ